MNATINRLIDGIGRNLRRILPEDWDFCFVVWRVIDTSEEIDKVEVAMVSHGNPGTMEGVLRDIIVEVKRHDSDDTPVSATAH
ncbi:MAG: hypothetical protein ABWY63_14240 [Hyphomicrobiaceae bacterium]